MIVYFTGTGNSRYVAEILGDMTGDEIMDAGKLIRQKDYAPISSHRPWIFTAPVYGWRMARIFAEWMEKTEFCGTKDAYFFLTCGSDAGNSGIYLERLCRKKGLIYKGLQEVVMPENYIAMFKAPGKRLAAKIRKAAVPKVKEAAEKILAGERLHGKKVTLAERVKSFAVNPAFYALFVKSKSFYVKDKCIGCGKCAFSCPVSGIIMQDGKPRWTGNCSHCMACICGCGASAIEYGNKSKHKMRYQCPPYDEEKMTYDEV